MSAGIGLMSYGAHQGSGKSGFEQRQSFKASYDDGKFGISLGTNIWKGLHSQQTGMIGVRAGDFRMTYENDGAPFAPKKWSEGILGDNNDRWRTAAMIISIKDLQVGFNLFTGERTKDSYAENGDDSWDAQRMKEGGCYSNGACLPHSYVEEKGSRYRLGAAYFSYGSYRIGIDSDRHVRHPIQNILAHDWI